MEVRDKFAVLHPAHAQHVIGKMLNFAASAFHDHNFQAIVRVKVDVSGRQYVVMMVVLSLRQLVGEVRTMVVVNHGKRGNDRPVVVHLFGNQGSRIRSRNASERLPYPRLAITLSNRSSSSRSIETPVRTSSAILLRSPSALIPSRFDENLLRLGREPLLPRVYFPCDAGHTKV